MDSQSYKTIASSIRTAIALGDITEMELRLLNTQIINAIKDSNRRKSDALRSKLSVGDRVMIDHPRCIGNIYKIERFTAKSAILRQDYKSEPGKYSLAQVRATVSLLKPLN